MFSCSEDEVDIVGEGEIYDVEEELHVETHLPFINVGPISKYLGLSKL